MMVSTIFNLLLKDNALHQQAGEGIMNKPFIYTEHAQVRCQQRGIKRSLVQLVQLEADEAIEVGNNMKCLWVTKRRIEELRANGINRQTLEQLGQVRILISSGNGALITAFHDQGFRGRPYRRQHKNGHRRKRDYCKSQKLSARHGNHDHEQHHFFE